MAQARAERLRLQQEEILKKAYRELARKLRDSTVEEERQINQFQQERERINYIWMLQKKKIEEAQAELINKEREKEDLEEKHKIENKLYMQRIKYQMLKQQDENVELQKEAEIALKQMEDVNRHKEKDFKYDFRSLNKMEKEQEVLQNDFIYALVKDQIKAIHELKNDFELKEEQMRKFYGLKIKELKNNMEEKTKKEINFVTEKKMKGIKQLTDDHATYFNNMKNYYYELNKKNLNQLKTLAKNFSEALKEQNNLKSKKMNKINKKKKIEDPLNSLRNDIEKKLLQEKECLENYKNLKNNNELYKTLMKELLDFEYKYEVTLQNINYLEKELASIKNNYKDKLNEVEQKAGLRNLILEKKLETIEDNLEIKEVQLRELLKQTQLDPLAIANVNSTLEEVELMKGEMINNLEEELKKIKEVHIDMIKTYEAKLTEFHIPIEEMGFEPLIPVDIKNYSN